MKIVILCGGTGSRLWPMSRRLRPKQFFPILSGNSMIRDTFDRFQGDFPTEDIYFSTNPSFAIQLEEIFPKLPLQNYIIEPHRRDTAAAMGFVAAYLSNRFADEPMVFVPSDHFIGDQKQFLHTLKVGEHIVRATGKMVDIGVYPTFPSTVLGYTHVGGFQDIDGVRSYEFLGHTEKPDFETAKRYLENGHYLWHASYYMWTPAKFLDCFRRHVPEMYEDLMSLREALLRKDEVKVQAGYERLPKQAFDYVITEKLSCSEMTILRGDFGWSDVGSWDVLYDRLIGRTDEAKNLVKGDWIGIDTTSCLVYGPKDKLIATIGIDDVVVVDTEDVLLICSKGRASDVKNLVERVKSDYKDRV